MDLTVKTPVDSVEGLCAPKVTPNVRRIKDMDEGTWNRLTQKEQAEVRSMGSAFIKAVFKSHAIDGWDFMQKYELSHNGTDYIITEKETNSQFGDFKSKSKAVISALMTDAAQNYGR